MLGEKDLIFLGTMLLMTGTYPMEQSEAIEEAQEVYNQIFTPQKPLE